MIKKYIKPIVITLLLVIVLGVTSCKAQTADIPAFDKNELDIIVTSDIHYLSEKMHDDGEAFHKFYENADGKLTNYSEHITNAFVSEVISKKPDVLIISGDLTSNGEKVNHTELAGKLAKIEEAGTNVYVIPGNHDINNPWARSFKGSKQIVADYVTEKDFKRIYNDFGYGEALSKDKNTLSYFVRVSNNVYLLMLDTNIYNANIHIKYPFTGGVINGTTQDWITRCASIAKENGAEIIPVMHHNLIAHSEVINNGFVLDNKKSISQLFSTLRFNLVFSGHIHVQSIAKVTVNNFDIYEVVNSALSVYPVAYGVLHVNGEGLEYSTKELDVSGWAERNGIQDSNLLDFSNYSKEFFVNVRRDEQYKRLISSGKTDREAELMTETMAVLNTHYFAGTTNEIAASIIQTEGYKLWADYSQGFTGYIESISKPTEIDCNKLLLRFHKNE